MRNVKALNIEKLCDLCEEPLYKHMSTGRTFFDGKEFIHCPDFYKNGCWVCKRVRIHQTNCPIAKICPMTEAVT